MNNFQITTKVSTFDPTKGGLLTGQIWMVLDGEPFPEAGWNDFILVVLGWWCRTFSDLPKRGTKKKKGKLRFMDGPFFVSMSTDVDGHFRLLACTNSGQSIGAPCRCSTEEARQQLVAAAGVALKYCEQHGIETSDTQELRAEFERLLAGAPN